MWVIFRDPNTPFNHTDKFVVDVVGDDDILPYQTQMGDGRTYEIYLDVYFLQPFFTTKTDVQYFARKYKVWADHASMYSAGVPSGTEGVANTISLASSRRGVAESLQ
jgi:hypothetical protein